MRGPVEPDPGNSGGGKVQKTSGSPLHQEGNVMKNTLLISTMLSATAAFAETPVLTVYAPDYFASEWGPGPAIEAEFEKHADAICSFLPAICCRVLCLRAVPPMRTSS